jgi:hypothetical protein
MDFPRPLHTKRVNRSASLAQSELYAVYLPPVTIATLPSSRGSDLGSKELDEPMPMISLVSGR